MALIPAPTKAKPLPHGTQIRFEPIRLARQNRRHEAVFQTLTESRMNIECAAELTGYLRERGHDKKGENPKITVLAGGVSNRTVLVGRENGPAWVLKQALAKLRVASDWFSSPERIHREALGLRWLSQLAPPGAVPR